MRGVGKRKGIILYTQYVYNIILQSVETERTLAGPAPNVDVRRVVDRGEEHVGRPVPERYHLRGVCLKRGRRRPRTRQPKVRELQLTTRCHQQLYVTCDE